MAIVAAGTGGRWAKTLAPGSNADESSVAFASFPDPERHRELLARLVERSTTDGGLDRALLRRIDREAWGITDD